MRKFRIFPLMIVLSGLLFASCSSSKNLLGEQEKSTWNTNYTYVFVHGLSGWGHYEFRNAFFPYWGMKNGSLMKQLRKEGIDCADASVSPHGSAWDRACELYAQLTGSRTDYGVEHSAKCGHARFGKDYSKKPLISAWDSEKKINLIGHSFGGLTVRLLAHLMSEGSEAERIATEDGDLSPLFAGGHGDWIYSVTALAAPHNGTSAYHVADKNPEEKSGMEKTMERTNAPKRDGRADFDYADFDMHIPNAAEINSWLVTLDSAYYFSYPCSCTKADENGNQVVETGITEKFFVRSALRLGSFEGCTEDGVNLGKEWQENDGLVNTISARAPDFAPSQNFDAISGGELKKGIWYVMPTFRGDHMSIIGGLTLKRDIRGFYINHLHLINSL